jgi:hypothetical protein
MKFLTVLSSVYVSSTAIAVYFYPELFVPLTISYISGAGVYGLWNKFERKIAK